MQYCTFVSQYPISKMCKSCEMQYNASNEYKRAQAAIKTAQSDFIRRVEDEYRNKGNGT